MVGEMALLDWGGMFAVLGHGKDVAVGAAPSEIGVRPGEGEGVFLGFGDGEGIGAIGARGGISTLSTYRGLLPFIALFCLFWLHKKGFGWLHLPEDISITENDVINYKWKQHPKIKNIKHNINLFHRKIVMLLHEQKISITNNC